jgi:UMF1 family MFS transporter
VTDRSGVAAGADALDRRQVASWCLFDFANSSYSAVVVGVVFQVYYITAIVGNSDGRGDLWWGRAISASMLLVSLSSPFIGGIADLSGLRKRLLGAYTAVCVAAVAGFASLEPGDALAGFLLILVANVGMEGGLVFYNSFLPQIAPPQFQGRVSGWGFGVGYAGSILSLLIALPLAKAGRFDAIWILVAVFFAVFSLPAFRVLPGDERSGLGAAAAARRGLAGAAGTLREIWRRPHARRFLLAYLVYEDGVNTVIIFSSSLAATTFGFGQGELIGLYLVVQVSALAGAFALARPIDAWGPKKVVSLSLLLWASVSVAAYFAAGKAQYWAVACVAGLGLGSVQAGTRAFFSQFVPAGKEAEYFGVYSLVGKTSAVFGPLVFGQISAALGSQRPAILSIALFFAAGLALLSRVQGGGPNLVNGESPQRG